MLELTSEQQAAVDAMAHSEARFSLLTGLAGTGKTTVMRALADRLEAQGRRVLIAAPTGKASLILARKTGRPASTVHGLLYSCVIEDDVTDELRFSGNREAITGNSAVIVDEASMVGRRMHRDLDERMPTDARCYYVGDQGQLTPVNDTWGPDFDRPTATLTTIHRQAAGSSIVQAAHWTRRNDGPPFKNGPDGKYRYAHAAFGKIVAAAVAKIQPAVSAREAPPFIVLVARRKTRAAFNDAIRKAMGVQGWPTTGEALRVCMNNYRSGLVNGEIVTVLDPGETRNGARQGMVVRTATAAEHTVNTVRCGLDNKAWKDAVSAHTKQYHKDAWHNFDFAYASTCHAAQGSEWPSVAVYADDAQEYMSRGEEGGQGRWFYTAITRAQERCTLFTMPYRP